MSVPVALHEWHARRLETVTGLIEDALSRIETVLRGMPGHSGTTGAASPAQIRGVRESIRRLRDRIDQAAERFGIERRRPGWRQAIVAELSTLWVILENADPKRMVGYGRELAPEDKKDWKSLIERLGREVEQMRQIVLGNEKP